MRIPMIIALSTPLLSTGCDNSQPNQPSRQIAVRSDAQNQLHQLGDMERDIALKRAIHASGFRCKRVTKSGYVGEYRNLSMWTANCDDDRDWAIYAGPDGSAQVRLCKDVADFGLPPCVMNEKKTAG